MTEINMEELAILLYHNIPGVSVSNSQDVGGNQIANTRPQEVLFGHQEICAFVIVLQKRQGCLNIKRFDHLVFTMVLMDQ